MGLTPQPSASTDEAWYGSHTTLVSVASHAVHTGELASAEAVVDFFEKPWHYPELHEQWTASIEEEMSKGTMTEGQLARASMPEPETAEAIERHTR